MSSESPEVLTEKARAAFRRAAAKVVERARRTGTPVIVWEDGRVKELSADEAEARLRGAADVPVASGPSGLGGKGPGEPLP